MYVFSPKVFSSDCRNSPALFLTENLNVPPTASLLLSVAVLETLRLPRSCVNLFTRLTVESSVSVFVTIPVPLVVLPVAVNVKPLTEMEAVFSVTVYVPRGRSSNVLEALESIVNSYASSPKVFSSDCRYLPSLSFTVNLKEPLTGSLLLSVAVFLTIRFPVT